MNALALFEWAEERGDVATLLLSQVTLFAIV